MFRNLLLVVMCAFILAACSNNDELSSNDLDMIDKGLAAVAAKDLGKAEGIFESASDNEKSQKYYAQIVLVREGQKLLESGNAEEGNAKLEAAASYQGGSELVTEIANDMLATATLTNTKNEKEDQDKEKDEKKAEPTQAASSTSGAVVISDKASGMSFVQLTNKTGNVRGQPSIDSEVVYSGEIGEVFVYLQEKVNTSDGRTWYKVEYNSGLIGYISHAVSNLTSEINDYRTFDSTLLVTAETANIRAEPSIDSEIIIQNIGKGEMFVYTGYYSNTPDGRTWYEVEIHNDNYRYGFISKAVSKVQ